MEELTQGIRELHTRVGDLDALLRERSMVTDLSERRADAAHEQATVAQHAAQLNSRRIRVLWICGLFVALLWTPLTAYGAVWVHERIRNNCYPGALYVAGPPPSVEAWYCGIFPGTSRDHHH